MTNSVETRKMRFVVGAIITFAWVVSLLAGIATHDHHAAELATPIMIIYVSYLYGDAMLKKRFPTEGKES